MEVEKFAWWPVRVTSGKQVWLSTYIEHKTLYDSSTGKPPISSMYFVWTETPKEQTLRLLRESVGHNRNIWNEYQLTKEDRA
jgi:hypothetical protein